MFFSLVALRYVYLFELSVQETHEASEWRLAKPGLVRHEAASRNSGKIFFLTLLLAIRITQSL
jgi:hypothetical protein